MPSLDPRSLIPRLAAQIPISLRNHAYLAGSLAAAWHFRAQLKERAIRTKDADVVIRPVGAIDQIRRIAESLRKKGWRWRDQEERGPGTAATGNEDLAAIRLRPPSNDEEYFLEFLGVPAVEQATEVRWERIILKEGHYGVPCFRFMGFTSLNLRPAAKDLRYADPAMMALSNLLSHPRVGTHEMSSPIEGRKCLRSAKDLGRILAFAKLLSRRETMEWKTPWLKAMKKCFPRSWRVLGATAGQGLRVLLRDRRGMSDAWWTASNGLLFGHGVTETNLKFVGEQLLHDLIGPVEDDCRGAAS